MNKIQAVLVDDEPSNSKTLQILLNKHCPLIEVCGSFTNPEKALKEIPKLNPQLLFLDIEMPGLNGFDLLNKLKKYTGSVIFVTAHSNYAVRAFKFSAIDYLLKPVDGNELKLSVGKFTKSQQAKPDSLTLKQLSGNLEFLSQPVTRKIAVPTNESIEIIFLDEVEYLKADSSYCIIKRTGKADLLVSKTLKAFEETLPPDQFVRVHSSYLININKLTRYVKTEGGYIVMNDSTQIALSRTYRDEFLNRLKI